MEDEERWDEERRRRRRLEKDRGDGAEEKLLCRGEKEGGGLNQAGGCGNHRSDGPQRVVPDGARGAVQIGAGVRDGVADERWMMRPVRGMQGACASGGAGTRGETGIRDEADDDEVDG